MYTPALDVLPHTNMNARMIGTTSISDGEIAKIEDIEKALRPVVTQHNCGPTLPGLSIIDSDTQGFASPLLRSILFSFANNFAGIDVDNLEPLLKYVEQAANDHLYQMIRSTSQHYTTRAITHSIFKFAIEVGNAHVINLLLSDCSHEIQLNACLCLNDGFHGSRCTPLERAAFLGHEDVMST